MMVFSSIGSSDRLDERARAPEVRRMLAMTTRGHARDRTSSLKKVQNATCWLPPPGIISWTNTSAGSTVAVARR
jgi:hypothetical protein